MTKLRTEKERTAAGTVARIFEESNDSVEVRLENFPRYVRRQHLKRFLSFYELFKLVLPIKGSIVECGVYRGFGVMAFAKLSAILEPENLTRRVYGFDTFSGFPSLAANDISARTDAQPGDLAANSYDELNSLIAAFDDDRFLGHIPKVDLIRGDMTDTIPRFVKDNPHLLVSLLFIDCDLYEPTVTALREFIPRMPAGSVIAFDDLDNPLWPGETRALLEQPELAGLRLQRLVWDPYIAYMVKE
jgi:hypothetical protein